MLWAGSSPSPEAIQPCLMASAIIWEGNTPRSSLWLMVSRALRRAGRRPGSSHHSPGKGTPRGQASSPRRGTTQTRQRPGPRRPEFARADTPRRQPLAAGVRRYRRPQSAPGAAGPPTPGGEMGSQQDGGQEPRFRSDMTVELVKHCAADSDVVWAARVSTVGEQSFDDQRSPEQSQGLINYLMRDRHGSPF